MLSESQGLTEKFQCATPIFAAIRRRVRAVRTAKKKEKESSIEKGHIFKPREIFVGLEHISSISFFSMTDSCMYLELK